MTDPTGFSIGMPVNPTGTFKPLPDWVAFDLCHAYPVPGGNLLLHNPRNGGRAMVKPDVYGVLMKCSQFKTLDQHVATITEFASDAKGQEADIRRVLQRMIQSGIMLTAKDVCNELKVKVENPTDDQQNIAPVVAVLTWERPQALERLLESITTNCATEKFHRLYVIDDSSKSENIEANRSLTRQFSSRMAVPLQYFGRQEQRSFLNDLVKELPEHENAVRFVADYSRWENFWTSGLSRNLALLLSAGRHLVMIDDDVICEVYDPPQPSPNITFSTDSREAVFFSRKEDWAYLRQPINPDPVNRHMQCLGLTFPEALAVLGENHLKQSSFQNATASLLNELRTDSQVLVTESGSFGCPGTSNNTWLPNMTRTSLKRMLASETTTTNALNSRKVWSGRNHPHFSPRSNMSQITGFDNRRMLPPYLPIFRNEDRLFGRMLDFIFPTSVILDYPWAVPHLPLPSRMWRARDLDFSRGDFFPMFFVERIIEHKSACLSTHPEKRLSSLSGWFGDLASAPADTLTSMYQDNRLGGDSVLLTQLTELLAESDSAPVNWKNYLRNGITQLNTDLDLASRGDFRIRGLPANLEGEALIEFWRKTWRDFADAIGAWPEIRQAAERITGSHRAD